MRDKDSKDGDNIKDETPFNRYRAALYDFFGKETGKAYETSNFVERTILPLVIDAAMPVSTTSQLYKELLEKKRDAFFESLAAEFERRAPTINKFNGEITADHIYSCLKDAFPRLSPTKNFDAWVPPETFRKLSFFGKDMHRNYGNGNYRRWKTYIPASARY